MTIIGCRVRGCWHRSRDFSGRRDIGDGAERRLFFMSDIGDRELDFTAGSTMATDILAADMKVDVGKAIDFTTTVL